MSDNPSGQAPDPTPDPDQPPPGGYAPPPGGYPPPATGGVPAPATGGFPAAPPAPQGAQPVWSTGAPLTVGQAVSYGWSKFRADAGTWVAATLVVVVVVLLIEVLFSPTLREGVGGDAAEMQRRLDEARGFGNVVLAAVASILAFVVSAFLVQGAITATYRGRVAPADFLRLRATSQVAVLAIVTGVISLVLAYVPYLGALVQLVVQFFLTFALYFVLDQGQGALAAVGSSARLVGGRPGLVLLLLVTVAALFVLGLVICLVGLLATVPTGLLALAYAYRRLTGGTPV